MPFSSCKQLPTTLLRALSGCYCCCCCCCCCCCIMALLFAFTCGFAAVPRLLTVGLSNAAIHLGQLGLRPASYTLDGMWAPKESVLAGAEPKDWSVVVVSGRDVDAKVSEFARAANEFARVAAESSATELVVAGVGEDSEAWLRLARRGVGLLTLSEVELGVVEGWLHSETGVAPPPPPPAAALVGSVRSVRDRATELGGTLGAARVCVTRGRRGAALWCEGGRRPNGMRSSMVKVPPLPSLSSAPVPPRGVEPSLAALGSSALLRRGRPTGLPLRAVGARASRRHKADDVTGLEPLTCFATGHAALTYSEPRG